MTNKRPVVYVITGGGGGIGIATARRLGRRGILLLTDIDSSHMEQVAAELRSEGVRVETQVSDIANEESVRLLVNTTTSLGRLAGLVHTAGISPSMANWKRIFEVNLIGTALLLKGFLPLAEQGTVAICVASSSGYHVTPEPAIEAMLSEPLVPEFIGRIEPFLDSGNPEGSAYSLSKRGIMLLCEVMSPAWGERGARIVSVSPGIIDTPQSRLEFESHPSMKNMVELTPLKRIGKPEEMAATFDFLLSEDASFITGVDIRVDGGMIPFVTRLRRS